MKVTQAGAYVIIITVAVVFATAALSLLNEWLSGNWRK